MRATRFLYISGFSFLLAAALSYFKMDDAAFVVYVVALAFLVFSIVALARHFWTASRRKGP
jgi:hypothetical protein